MIMSNHIINTLFDLFDSFSALNASIDSVCQTINGAKTYFYDFLDLISIIFYFIPKQHFIAFMTVSLSSIVFRATLSVWRALPLT